MIDVTEICEPLEYITEEILFSYRVGTGEKWQGEIPLWSPEISELNIKELSQSPALSMGWGTPPIYSLAIY